jgi:predicted DNA-binding transcriptional regulator AlpA
VLSVSKKDKLLSKAEVLERVGCTFPTIWKLMRDGKFPMALSIGTPNERYGKPVWRETDIDEWIANLPVKRYKGVA